MRAHVIENGKITNTIEVDALNTLPALHLVDASVGGRIGDAWVNGAPVPPPAPLPTVEEYTALAQGRLDAFARTRNYDGILSACTYSTSSVPRFSAEGQYAVSARDSTWATCYSLLDQVQRTVIAQPSLEQFAAMLPALAWPT